MIPTPTMDFMEHNVYEKHQDQQKIIGIMLANYSTSFVKGIMQHCYRDWHIASGSDFDIYWPGYGHYLSPACQGIDVVNFNPYLSVEETNRHLEAFRRNTPDPYDLSGTKNNIYQALNNANQICFCYKDYSEAKKKIRTSIGLTSKQQIDSMTLVLARYYDQTLHFQKKDCIIVNLRSLFKSDLHYIDTINEFMSQINDYCVSDVDFQKLTKLIQRITPKEKKDRSVPITTVINALKDIILALITAP